MTLHWWMHWFWVTAQIVVSLSSPASNVTADPASLAESTSQPPPTEAARMLTATEETLERLQQSYRIAKAIGIQPTADVVTTHATVTVEPPGDLRLANNTAPPGDPPRSTAAPLVTDIPENRTTQVGRIPGKKESKITWVQAFSKPPRVKFEDKPTPPPTTPRHEPSPEELTVMPLREEAPAATAQPDPNAIRRDQQQQQLQPIVQTNRSAATGELRLGEDPGEPHLVATAASVLEGSLIDSTRLGRARGAFTSEFQREQLSREQQRTEGHGEAAATAKEGANVTEIATITGSCLAVIVLLSTVGSLGFIMYRRRYLNPPQTLNSDKCSNPDSSGYIDDSTIRDNSEEMYSLDNDSFLNSLEAMTIQNYWTDSVKHTKL